MSGLSAMVLTFLDQIRRDRDKKRAQIQADLDKKLNGLRGRIEKSVKDHIQQMSALCALLMSARGKS